MSQAHTGGGSSEGTIFKLKYLLNTYSTAADKSDSPNTYEPLFLMHFSLLRTFFLCRDILLANAVCKIKRSGCVPCWQLPRGRLCLRLLGSSGLLSGKSLTADTATRWCPVLPTLTSSSLYYLLPGFKGGFSQQTCGIVRVFGWFFF